MKLRIPLDPKSRPEPKGTWLGTTLESCHGVITRYLTTPNTHGIEPSHGYSSTQLTARSLLQTIAANVLLHDELPVTP